KLVRFRLPDQSNTKQKGRQVKISRSDAHTKAHALPEVRAEEQQLTAVAGLIVFQPLFERLGLRDLLKGCFGHLKANPVFGHATVVTLMIVHILIGHRRLQEINHYKDDPIVQRVLHLKRLPDVSTVSRNLKQLDDASVKLQRQVLRKLVGDRLKTIAPARVTLDFDGSVNATNRKAQGAASGYNKKKKGQRSYYPLFCTLAQTGQVFDFHHRPGNVHDSNGAKQFILACIMAIREILPGTIVETRMDSAFFSEEIVKALTTFKVEFTISVPFDRFTRLKAKLEKRVMWSRVDRDVSYFEEYWKPESWKETHRFIFVRTREAKQRKGPIQLDMFAPHVYGFEFKVILTSMTLSARKTVLFHNGRGAQEAIFAELKSHAQMDYIPCNRLAANQTWLFAAVMAHNLNRELQMSTQNPVRETTEQRAPWWKFVRLATRRLSLIRRPGLLNAPQGRLTLTINADADVASEMKEMLQAA
ncbi:MAG: IS1380 family transposase, partial [Verrucomicrobia bacterium]|nr:IS1380 family transposase [Verrucomicrobiota bacterium]